MRLEEVREFLLKVYNRSVPNRRTSGQLVLDAETVWKLACNLRGGVKMATPVFDGATEERNLAMLELARDLPRDGQTPALMVVPVSSLIVR